MCKMAFSRDVARYSTSTTLRCIFHSSTNYVRRFDSQRLIWNQNTNNQICGKEHILRNHITIRTSSSKGPVFHASSLIHSHAVPISVGKFHLHQMEKRVLPGFHKSLILISPQTFLMTERQKHTSKANKKNKQRKSKQDIDEDSDSDDSDDEVESLDDDFTEYFDEDADFPDVYKETKHHFKSLRIDSVLSKGLSISRKKIDDFFLSSKIRVNGQKVLKLGKQVSEGDYIDLVNSDPSNRGVKRVRVVKVREKKNKDSAEVYLRSWRANVPTDQY